MQSFIGGILLPLSHRQKVNHGGILTIQSVQRAADEGEYSCVVRSMDGQSATGTTHVSVVGMYTFFFIIILTYEVKNNILNNVTLSKLYRVSG